MTCRVVLVDDTVQLRDLIAMVLTASGFYEVVGVAGNGAEGTEVVRATQPDVVLLDVAMPVLDGMSALPQIRLAAPAAAVIMLSGFPAAQMRQKALAAGAFAYIEKGPDLASLPMLLTEILD